MKRRLGILIVMIIFLISFTGCNKENTSSENESNLPGVGELGSVSFNEPILFSPNISCTDNDNPRVDFTEDEVVGIISEHSKFKISEDFSANIPKSIHHVSTFYNGNTPALSEEDAIEDFRASFEFLFPSHEFDEDCFFYMGKDGSREPDSNEFRKVRNHYEDIISGKEELNMLFYHDLEANVPKEERVSFVYQSPFGNSLMCFNKNVTTRKEYELGLIDNYGGDVFSPTKMECVGRFDANSEESFPLLDKTTSINEASAFLKEFVDNLPCCIEPFYSISINNVWVYKLTDNLYCYFFDTSKLYDNIPFDYKGGNSALRYPCDISSALMIKSNDVDYIYNTYKLDTVVHEDRYTEFIKFEEAVEIASNTLTSYVEFEMTRAELVYCRNENIGTFEFGETCYPVFPAWKIILYNPNDDCYYNCYINALTGKLESHK